MLELYFTNWSNVKKIVQTVFPNDHTADCLLSHISQSFYIPEVLLNGITQNYI